MRRIPPQAVIQPNRDVRAGQGAYAVSATVTSRAQRALQPSRVQPLYRKAFLTVPVKPHRSGDHGVEWGPYFRIAQAE
jgi:hypothetical protein